MKAIGSSVGSIMPWKASMKCCWAAPFFFAGLKYQGTKSNSSVVYLVATFGCLGRVVGRNLVLGCFCVVKGFLSHGHGTV